MVKKISAVFLVMAFAAVLLCGCKPSEPDNNSSLDNSEPTYSENVTSSIPGDTESNNDNENEEGSSSDNNGDKTPSNSTNNEKNPSSSGSSSSEKNENENTSSEKPNNNQSSGTSDPDADETSSNDSSSEDTSSDDTSSEDTSSDNTSSGNTSSDNTSSGGNEGGNGSSTESGGIIANVNPAKTTGIGVWHFQPYWTTNYGTSVEKRMEEFEDVLKEGYFNTVIVSEQYAANEQFWEICIENNVSVWMSIYSFYNSSKTTINAFMANVDKIASKIQSNPEWWSNFNGFEHEENILRGQSNADFLASTEALYKKYGKRNFVCHGTGEFTNFEGNQNQINMDATNIKKVNPQALKYITDAGLDSYSVDVRDGAPNGNKYKEWQSVSPNIVDGKTYFSEHTKVLLSLYDHDVNVWFLPCAYTTYLWGGLNGLKRADEAYCLAHLEFFYDLLNEYEFKGGMFLYTYKDNTKNVLEQGMQSHLVVESSTGGYKLCPDEAKWEKYSKRLKEMTSEFKSKQASLIYGI